MSKKARFTLLPVPEHMSQAEAILYLKRQVFDDACAAGWLKPCVRKPGKGRDSVYYATRTCQEISLRIANGEYPVPLKEKGAKAA